MGENLGTVDMNLEARGCGIVGNSDNTIAILEEVFEDRKMGLGAS